MQETSRAAFRDLIEKLTSKACGAGRECYIRDEGGGWASLLVTPLLSALGGGIVLVHAVFSFKLRLKR